MLNYRFMDVAVKVEGLWVYCDIVYVYVCVYPPERVDPAVFALHRVDQVVFRVQAHIPGTVGSPFSSFFTSQ